VGGCSYVNIQGNVVEDSGYAGIISGNASHHITIGGNIVSGPASDAGIHLFGSCYSSIISNNVVQGAGMNIACENASYDNLVIGNYVSEATLWGIRITGSWNSVIGNECRDSAQIGITLNEAHNSLVIGNHSYHNGRTGLGVSDSDNVLVSGNFCHANSQNLTNTYSEIGIAGNAPGSRYCSVHANICRSGGGAAVPKYGIDIGSDSSYCVVAGNDLYDDGFGTAPLSNAGTNNIIKDNRGYNPVGISAITVGASPYTYTAGASPETVYVSGGTVTSIAKGGNNFGLTSGGFNLEPYESVIVTYTVTPTMFKDVH